MIFRCSVCKGQFELDVDAKKKAVVFCAHCGAALRTGKPGEHAPHPPTPAEMALLGNSADSPAAADLGGSSLEQLANAKSHGYVEAFDPSAPADAAADPGNDPLAALAGGGGGSAPRSTARLPRRPLRRQDNTAAIMIVSALGLVAMFVVIIVVVIFLMQPEPEKKKKEEYSGGDGPGFYNKVKEGQTRYPQNADPPKKAPTQDPPDEPN